MQSIASAPQLAGSLRSAQKQQRQNRFRGGIELKCGVEVVLPAHGASADHLPGQLFFLQRIERALNLRLGGFHDRLAIRLLIARRDQRVERQRVVLGCRHLLFGQTSQDADLQRLELAGRHSSRLPVAGQVIH